MRRWGLGWLRVVERVGLHRLGGWDMGYSTLKGIRKRWDLGTGLVLQGHVLDTFLTSAGGTLQGSGAWMFLEGPHG